jgi:hypothetical protein
MNTRPKHRQVTKGMRRCYALEENRVDTPCARQRFFVEARKRDDGGVLRISVRDLGALGFVALVLNSLGRRSRSERPKSKAAGVVRE